MCTVLTFLPACAVQLNIACPSTGCQKMIEVEDEKKLRAFYDKRISDEVEGDVLGPEFEGYVFRISGGNDLQGFPMMQGVLVSKRVRLLLKKGSKCYRPRKAGERKRKSVRGCIVSHDLSVLNLVVIKKGKSDVEGLTDEASARPRRLGPKRASKIRKMFDLPKDADVTKAVIYRDIEKDGKKVASKAPKIQRLITPRRIRRKAKWRSEKAKRFKASKAAAREYNELIAKRAAEERQRRQSYKEKRRSLSRKLSEKKAARA